MGLFGEVVNNHKPMGFIANTPKGLNNLRAHGLCALRISSFKLWGAWICHRERLRKENLATLRENPAKS